MTKNSNKDFKLRKFSLEFERGYSWEKESEKQKDRYEGSVTFTNDLREEFTLNVDTELSLEIIKLISNKLTENISESINITEQ